MNTKEWPETSTLALVMQRKSLSDCRISHFTIGVIVMNFLVYSYGYVLANFSINILKNKKLWMEGVSLKTLFIFQ